MASHISSFLSNSECSRRGAQTVCGGTFLAVHTVDQSRPECVEHTHVDVVGCLLSLSSLPAQSTDTPWIMAYFMVMLALCVIVCQHNVPKPCESSDQHHRHASPATSAMAIARDRSFDLILYIESEAFVRFVHWWRRRWFCVMLRDQAYIANIGW